MSDTENKAPPMLKEIQVSLYDFFGYLLPGIPVVLGVTLLFLTAYTPPLAKVPPPTAPSISLLNDMPSVAGWFSLALLAYFAGHMGQALGNGLPARADNVAVNNIKGKGLPPCVIAACRSKAKAIAPYLDEQLPPKWLVRFCDTSIMLSGSAGDREVYVYREGFYRGLAIGCLVLFVGITAFIIRLTIWPISVTIGVVGWEITRRDLGFFLVLAAACSFLSYQRYERFGAYRATHALLGFLASPAAASHENPCRSAHARGGD